MTLPVELCVDREGLHPAVHATLAQESAASSAPPAAHRLMLLFPADQIVVGAAGLGSVEAVMALPSVDSRVEVWPATSPLGGTVR